MVEKWSGFTNMMIKLIEDFKPKSIAVTFDYARETFRNKIYLNYKSNRVSPPEDLIPQFSIIKDDESIKSPPINKKSNFLLFNFDKILFKCLMLLDPK